MLYHVSPSAEVASLNSEEVSNFHMRPTESVKTGHKFRWLVGSGNCL